MAFRDLYNDIALPRGAHGPTSTLQALDGLLNVDVRDRSPAEAGLVGASERRKAIGPLLGGGETANYHSWGCGEYDDEPRAVYIGQDIPLPL